MFYVFYLTIVQIKFTSIIKACSVNSFTDTEEQKKNPKPNAKQLLPPTKKPIMRFG